MNTLKQELNSEKLLRIKEKEESELLMQEKEEEHKK